MKFSSIYLVFGFIIIWWHIVAILWKIIRGIHVHLLPKWTNDQVNLIEKFGNWAVVTGATDGIGRAYSMELAKRGINIVLISRTLEKLQDTATEIQKLHQVKTKIIQIDFGKGFSVYETIENGLKDISVGILVNNVGMFFPCPLRFTEVSPHQIDDIININVNSTLMMTRIVLPNMQKTRKGAIIIVSSICELISHPSNTLYSSTKRFLRSFCEGLEPDCRTYGITVQRLTPSFIQTGLSSFAKSTLNRPTLGKYVMPTPEVYASNAISTLGRKSVTSGYWSHSLQYYLLDHMPDTLLCIISEFLARRFKSAHFRKDKR